MSLKPKIATVSRGQLPSHFSESYPQFISFIEKYYEHLESSGNPLNFVRNVLENHDYDTADEYFKVLLGKGILTNLPTTLNVDKTVLIKNAREIYREKGTEQSYKFLLNALFGENAELEWGKNKYVRLNDSTIKQDTIITIRRPKISATAYINQARVTSIHLDNNDNGFGEVPTIKLLRNDPAEKDLPVFDFNLNGRVTAVNVINGGYGYTKYNISMTGNLLPGGSHATFSVQIGEDSSISSITVVYSGSGYTEKPEVIIEGDGTGAEIDVQWTAVLENITIVHGGSGFSRAPSLQLIGGTGTEINGTSVLPARTAEVGCSVNSLGVVDSASVNFPGQNYQYKPTIKIKWLPDTEAAVDVIMQGDKIIDIHVKDGGVGYTVAPTVVFDRPLPDLMGLQGNRIEQTIPFYATAIVEDVVSYDINGEELFVLYLKKDGLKGKFEIGSVVSSTFNNIFYSGVVIPVLTGVTIDNPGSMYSKGQFITLGKNGGIGGRGVIDSVSRGSVDGIVVTKGGEKYRVGDKIQTADHSSGNNFEGLVSSIDGIGATVTPLMEIDSYFVTDTGHGYQAGDILYIYGGSGTQNNLSSEAWAKAQVVAVTDSNNLIGFSVTSSGSGYVGSVSFAILPSPGSISPLRQIRPDRKSYIAGGVLDTIPTNMSYTLTSSAGIASLNWVLADTDLVDNTVTVAVNGVNGIVSILSVDGQGAITGLTIDNAGVNYNNPKLIYKSTGATRSPTIIPIVGTHGQITGFTIVNGGAGFTTSDIITIEETYGSGAFIAPIMNQGGVRSLNFMTRGESTGIDKNAAVPYTIMGGSGKGLKLDLYYRPAKIRIDSEGEFYTSYALQPTGGHGTGAAIQPIIRNGVVISLTLSTGGLNYSYCSIDINSANGIGFSATTELDANGTITKIDIISGGSGYQTGEDLLFAGSAKLGTTITTASGVVNVVRDGVITDVIVSSPGELYHPDCVAYFSSSPSPTREALINPIFTKGQLTGLKIVDGGAGYAQTTTGVIRYNETSSDVDPVPLFRAVGDYNNYALAVNKSATGTYMETSVVVSNNTSLIPGMAVEGAGIAYGTTVTSVSGTTINLTAPLIKNIVNSVLSFIPINHVTYNGATENVAQANTGYMQVFPTKSFCLVNSVFPVLDFVDIWPDVTAKPVEAVFNIFSSPMGKIIGASIDSAGSGYFSQEERSPLSLVVSGNGTGAVLQPVLENGSFVDVVILEGGQGYDSGASVEIIPSSGKGFGAIVEANVTDGQVLTYTVINGGTGYSRPGYSTNNGVDTIADYVVSGPQVKIIGSGSGAAAHCVVSGGVITAVVMDNAGTGYDKPVISTVGGQLNDAGTKAVFDVITTNGVITGVFVKNGGTGYYYGTSVYVMGNGIDGEIGVTVETGITDVSVIEGGHGYGTTATVLTITDNPPPGVAPGSGAILHPIITPIVVGGSGGTFTAIEIIDKGKGYYNPSITVTGSGTGANIVAISKRPINGIAVRSPGHNYVNAAAIVVGDGYGAKLRVKLSRNSINDIQIPYRGALYSESPKMTVIDNSNFGAISSVRIINSGDGYAELPSLTTVPVDRTLSDPLAKGGEVVAYSNSIGKIRSVRFEEFSIGSDYIPTVSFPITAIMAENAAFMKNERLYLKGYDYKTRDYSDGPQAKVGNIDYDRNIVSLTDCTDEYVFITEGGDTIELEYGTTNSNVTSVYIVHEDSFAIPNYSTLVGVNSGVEGKILRMDRATGYGVFGSVGVSPISITDSRSLINDNSAFIHNNQRYQDFSYIINTGLSIDQYSNYIDKILHPAGYSMYGNIKINTKLQSKMAFPRNEEGTMLNEMIVLWISLTPFYGKPPSHEYWRLESRRNGEVSNTIEEIDNMLTAGIESYETFPSDIRILEKEKSGTYSQVGEDLTVTCNAHGFSVDDIIKIDIVTGDASHEMLQIVSSTSDTFTTKSHYNITTSGSVTLSRVNIRLYGADTYTPWKTGTSYNINSAVFTGDDIYLGKKKHEGSSINYPDDEVEYFSGNVSVNGSYVITGISSTQGLQPGQGISSYSGAATIPSGTKILSVDSVSQITLDKSFSGSGSVVMSYEVLNPYWFPHYKINDITYDFL